jgi:asparagine synthase (glutamine-hydrolysing)
MCGIAGLISRHNDIDKSVATINKCLDSMYYRGPDNRQVEIFTFDNGHVVLGHLRLSIIDLDKRANQPMTNSTERYWIIFNGEIYNYKELKSKIKEWGDYDYKTTSDTEVLLVLYSMYQENMLTMLNGMFSFLIVDLVEDTLFYARDHVGIKPLYYAKSDNTFLFTSEPKAIIESNFLKFEVNKKIMFDFLARGIKDHTNETFFKGIKQVRAGYYGNISLDNFLLVSKNWFNWRTSKKYEFDEYVDHLHGMIRKSIRIRKRSDVEVGTTLSGGLDSSTVASLAKVDKTFTASFPGKDIDETRYAEAVCKANKLTSILIQPSNKEVLQEIERSLYIQGEPTGGLSTLAQYFVFKKINQVGIKVTLDGQGADELFMGYEYFKDYKFSTFKLLKNLAPKKLWVKMLEKRLHFLKKEVISKHFNRNRMGYKYQRKREFFLNQFFRFSLPHLLCFEDRNSMAFSVESRVPYLDPNIVRLVLNQPFEQNFFNDFQKYPLRLIADEYLPDNITWRKDKLGFAAPEQEWMQVLELEITSTLKEKDLFISEFVKESSIFKLLFNLKDLSKADARLLYRIYQAEKWFRIFS